MGSLVAKWLKLVVSDNHPNSWSFNSLHTWCAYWSMIWFLFMGAKFGHSVGRNLSYIGGFNPLSGILFTQFPSYVVYTLVKWVFRYYCIAATLVAFWSSGGQILAENCGFNAYMKYWSLNRHHMRCICTGYVSFQRWFNFLVLLRWPYLGPLVAYIFFYMRCQNTSGDTPVLFFFSSVESHWYLILHKNLISFYRVPV